MLNPFLRYPDGSRRRAIENGIVGDVARKTGINKSVISRAFSGETLQARPGIVNALNAWLGRHEMPKAGAVLAESAKTLACLALIGCVAFVWAWA